MAFGFAHQSGYVNILTCWLYFPKYVSLSLHIYLSYYLYLLLFVIYLDSALPQTIVDLAYQRSELQLPLLIFQGCMERSIKSWKGKKNHIFSRCKKKWLFSDFNRKKSVLQSLKSQGIHAIGRHRSHESILYKGIKSQTMPLSRIP